MRKSREFHVPYGCTVDDIFYIAKRYIVLEIGAVNRWYLIRKVVNLNIVWTEEEFGIVLKKTIDDEVDDVPFFYLDIDSVKTIEKWEKEDRPFRTGFMIDVSWNNEVVPSLFMCAEQRDLKLVLPTSRSPFAEKSYMTILSSKKVPAYNRYGFKNFSKEVPYELIPSYYREGTVWSIAWLTAHHSILYPTPVYCKNNDRWNPWIMNFGIVRWRRYPTEMPEIYKRLENQDDSSPSAEGKERE